MGLVKAIRNSLGEARLKQVFRAILFFVLVLIGSVNIYCTRTKYICSAYQSAFYIDREAAKLKYALKADADSMPLVEDLVRKTDVLLIAPMSKKRKLKSWEIVPMISVFPPKIELDSLDMMPADSTAEQDEPEEKDEDEDKPGVDSTKKVVSQGDQPQ